MPEEKPTADAPAEPTEDEQKAQKVAKAAADAAKAAPDAPTAIQEAQRAAAEEAERQGLTDDDVSRLSSQITQNVISELANRGAFEPPPEPVSPPPQGVAPPAATDGVTQAQTVPQPSPQPRKRTFAHRFMGIE
jgi:hypothetical protein